MKQVDSNESPTVALRRMHRRRMIFSGLVILMAGITLGVAGTLLVVRPGERRPPANLDVAVAGMLGRFRGELNLTPDQEKRIEAILRNRMQELEKLRIAARPKIEEQFQAMKREINEVLTEQQQSDWNKIIARLEGEFQRGMRRGPGRRGGPGGPGGPPDGFRGRDRLRRPPDGSEPNQERRTWRRDRGGDRFDPNGPRRPWGPPPDREGLTPDAGQIPNDLTPGPNEL